MSLNTQTADLSWMARFCVPDSTGIKQRPFSLDIDGTPWSVATDGVVVVAVQGSVFPPMPDLRHSTADRVRDLLAAQVSGPAISLAKLKEWCAPPEWPGHTLCPLCQGKRAISCEDCGGSGKTLKVCDYCGDEHGCTCPLCDEGWVECECSDPPLPVRRGWISGTLLNREYLARVLEHFDDEQVMLEVTTPESPVFVAGSHWRVVLMPMRGVLPGPEDARLEVEEL